MSKISHRNGYCCVILVTYLFPNILHCSSEILLQLNGYVFFPCNPSLLCCLTLQLKISSPSKHPIPCVISTLTLFLRSYIMLPSGRHLKLQNLYFLVLEKRPEWFLRGGHCEVQCCQCSPIFKFMFHSVPILGMTSLAIRGYKTHLNIK